MRASAWLQWLLAHLLAALEPAAAVAVKAHAEAREENRIIEASHPGTAVPAIGIVAPTAAPSKLDLVTAEEAANLLDATATKEEAVAIHAQVDQAAQNAT